MPWSFEDGDPYQRIVEDVVERRTSIRTPLLARLVLDAVELAQRNGEGWAERRLELLKETTATADVRREIRRQDAKSRVWSPAMGTDTEVPLNVGVHPRRDDGTKENWTQRHLLLDLSREEAVEWMEQQRVLQATQDAKVDAVLRYLRIWDKHPQATSIREACALAGVDPFTILAEEDQAI